jgi:hypothetical protein
MQEIGQRDLPHTVFISPTDYFGTNGYRYNLATLKEVLELIYSTDGIMYIRYDANRKNRKHYRVMIAKFSVDATTDWDLTARLFNLV